MSADSDMDPTVAFIKLQVRKRNIRQKALATHLGVTQKHISQVLSGKAGCSMPLARRMLDYLGYDLVAVGRRRHEVVQSGVASLAVGVRTEPHPGLAQRVAPALPRLPARMAAGG